MEYVRVHGTIANPLNRNLKDELEFIADTGAIYTVIPKNIAEKLQLEETDKRKFKTASEKSLSTRFQKHTNNREEKRNIPSSHSNGKDASTSRRNNSRTFRLTSRPC